MRSPSSIPVGHTPLIDAERLRIYPRIFLALYVFAAGLILLLGKPYGYDFVTFYAASKLTLSGHALDAFNLDAITAVEHAVLPQAPVMFHWGYPPIFQLIAAPLGLLPFHLAYLAFMTATLALFCFTLAQIEAVRPYRMALIASPAVVMCLFYGQNALLSAALFAGGIALMGPRPFLAGLVLAGLAYKPQLGILLPVALTAAGQWRAVMGATVGVLALSGIAAAVFGLTLWQAFFAHLLAASDLVQAGRLPWGKMPSAFVFCRLLGLSDMIAYGAQIVSALIAAGAVALVWRRQGPSPLAWATLITATLLVPAYMFDYEFAIMTVALGLIAADMATRGAAPWEKAALLVLFLMPLPIIPLAQLTHVQIGFLVLAGTLGLCLHRVLAARLDRNPTPRRARRGSVQQVQ